MLKIEKKKCSEKYSKNIKEMQSYKCYEKKNAKRQSKLINSYLKF